MQLYAVLYDRGCFIEVDLCYLYVSTFVFVNDSPKKSLCKCERILRARDLVCAVAATVAAQVYNSHPVDAAAQIESAAADNDFITQTVYGFLDFTTTIGNTVMVFSPQSAPPGKHPRKRARTLYSLH